LTDWSTGNCETNGINIHYTRTGGSKPPVILLHGLTANGACWAALAHAIEGDYDVIMPAARAGVMHPTWGCAAFSICFRGLGIFRIMSLVDARPPALLGKSALPPAALGDAPQSGTAAPRRARYPTGHNTHRWVAHSKGWAA
jgi:hypothetical protein